MHHFNHFWNYSIWTLKKLFMWNKGIIVTSIWYCEGKIDLAPFWQPRNISSPPVYKIKCPLWYSKLWFINLKIIIQKFWITYFEIKKLTSPNSECKSWNPKRGHWILYTGGDEIFLDWQKGAKSIFPSEYHILVTNMPLFHFKSF